jgi:hypothetical protein
MSIEDGASIGKIPEPQAIEQHVAFGERHRPFANGFLDGTYKGQGNGAAEYVSEEWQVGDGQATVNAFLPPDDNEPIVVITPSEEGAGFTLVVDHTGDRMGLLGLQIVYDDAKDLRSELDMISEITLGGVTLKGLNSIRGIVDYGGVGFAMFETWQILEGEEKRGIFIPEEHAGSLEVSLSKVQ